MQERNFGGGEDGEVEGVPEGVPDFLCELLVVVAVGGDPVDDEGGRVLVVLAEVLDGGEADGAEGGDVAVAEAFDEEEAGTQVHGDLAVEVEFVGHAGGVVAAEDDDDVTFGLDGVEAGDDGGKRGVTVFQQIKVVDAGAVLVGEVGVADLGEGLQHGVPLFGGDDAGGEDGVHRAENADGVSGVLQAVDKSCGNDGGAGVGCRCHDVEGGLVPLHRSHRFLAFQELCGFVAWRHCRCRKLAIARVSCGSPRCALSAYSSEHD